MRKRIGFAVFLGFCLAYPFELSAQEMSVADKKLLLKYLEKVENRMEQEVKIGE